MVEQKIISFGKRSFKPKLTNIVIAFVHCKLAGSHISKGRWVSFVLKVSSIGAGALTACLGNYKTIFLVSN